MNMASPASITFKSSCLKPNKVTRRRAGGKGAQHAICAIDSIKGASKNSEHRFEPATRVYEKGVDWPLPRALHDSN